MKVQRLSKTVALLVIAPAPIALCLLAITTRGNDGAKNELSKGRVATMVGSPAAINPSAPAIEQDDEQLGLWLNLRSNGFETKDVEIPAGDYYVVIQNASGLDNFGIRVSRSTGERVHEARLPPLKKRWRQVVHFVPGTYVVSEMDHPDWKCRITVTAPK